MQFVATKPGGIYQVTSTQGGQTVTLTCPTTGPGCISVVVFKSTGGVWFSSAWGPATSGDLPQTIEKVIASGVTTF